MFNFEIARLMGLPPRASEPTNGAVLISFVEDSRVGFLRAAGLILRLFVHPKSPFRRSSFAPREGVLKRSLDGHD